MPLKWFQNSPTLNEFGFTISYLKIIPGRSSWLVESDRSIRAAGRARCPKVRHNLVVDSRDLVEEPLRQAESVGARRTPARS